MATTRMTLPQKTRRRLAALTTLLLALGLSGVALGLGRVRAPQISKLRGMEILGGAAAPHGAAVLVGDRGANMLLVLINRRGRRHLVNGGRGVAHAVVVQRDGKIVVAGTSATAGVTPGARQMVVRRFRPGGAPDRSFGRRGTVALPGSVANGVALGPRGTIVAAGFIPGADGSPRVALARLRGNGKPDRSFGSGGVATVDLGPYTEAFAVGAQGGKVVFAGSSSPHLQVVDGIVGRVNGRGQLDRGFARGGIFRYQHPHGGAASGFTSLLVGHGTIVAAGGDVQTTGQHALFLGLNGGGGQRWVLTTPSEQGAFGGDNIGVNALAFAGGEILGAGEYRESVVGKAALWVVQGNGRPDIRQGPGGLIKSNLPALLGGIANGVATSGGGNVYTGGDLNPAGSRHGFLAHYRVGR